MQNTKAIFESILKRNFSATENKEFLHELTKAHPYFSPAHFFLLQATEENTEAYEKQAARTNLFFNNPHWLNFQLQQTGPPGMTHGALRVDLNSQSPEIQNMGSTEGLPDDTDAAGEAGMEKE